jgi:hypothetical protein
MNDIELIPLGKLRLSEANVRKNDSNLFIEELAANIEAKGLLQNLIVVPAKKRGMFDVTAGGAACAHSTICSARASSPRITPSPAASSTSMPPSSPNSR